MTHLNRNKRIVKNTLLLYFRMVLIMAVSLYTVRVVLNTLGVVDYGIYSVLGGLVAMFSFISGTMANASQRYFSYEIGRGDFEQLKKTFSITLTIYLIFGFILVLLAETVGLWFLNHKMTIPPERMNAANWVFQFTIFSFLFTMLTTPYNAAIIAHERMEVYAFVSIVEAILRLGIVYILVVFSIDKLKLYAVLMFLVTILVTFIYRTYCTRRFKECRFRLYWNKPLFIEIVGYSGWNLFGTLATVCNNQGIAIILNIFFGPVINTAQAISMQVNNAVSQFVQNFMTSVRPQIIKLYAVSELDAMLKLVIQSSRFSFFLIFILTIPMLLETEFIFWLWLKYVPEYVVLFTRIVLVITLIDSLSNPLMTAAQATGKVRLYQSIVGGMLLMNLPISYMCLRMGSFPQTVFIVAMVNSIVCFILRLIMLNRMIGLKIIPFLQRVILPIFPVVLLAYFIPALIHLGLASGWLRFIYVVISSFGASILAVYYIGMNSDEREFINQLIKGLLISREI
jgi:O-antigen/teichoic acid export membrane protein